MQENSSWQESILLETRKDILTKNYMFLRLLRIRNTFLPKISLKLNILEMRKFVLTMRIAIIILYYFIRKAILRRIWLIIKLYY